MSNATNRPGEPCFQPVTETDEHQRAGRWRQGASVHSVQSTRVLVLAINSAKVRKDPAAQVIRGVGKIHAAGSAPWPAGRRTARALPAGCASRRSAGSPSCARPGGKANHVSPRWNLDRDSSRPPCRCVHFDWTPAGPAHSIAQPGRYCRPYRLLATARTGEVLRHDRSRHYHRSSQPAD